MCRTHFTQTCVVLATVLFSGGVGLAQVRKDSPFQALSPSAPHQSDSSLSQSSDSSPRPTLFWVMLLPLLAAGGIGLALDGLEKRAQDHSEEISSLEFQAISELNRLVAETQNALKDIRSYLHSPSTSAQTLLSQSQRPLSQSEATEETARDGAAKDSASIETRASEDCQEGNRLFLDGQYTEAIAAYDRALQLRPNHHQAWSNRGSALFHLEQYDASIAAYDRALDLKPDYTEAWNNRGGVLAKLQRHQEAFRCYNRALQLQPNYPDAWINRGLVLMELGQYQDALLSYDKAAQFQPNNPDIWNYQGQALSALEKYDTALSAYDHAIGLKPEEPNFFYNKASCYAIQGNIDLAWEYLQKAMAFNASHYQARAQTDSNFAALQDDPRFQQLVNG